MAWKEPGGGRDPWSGKNGKGPPDLDELLQRLQRWLNPQSGGQGGGMGTKQLGLIALVVVAGWLFSGLYIVQPAERGVVMRFGEFHAITTEGPHWHMPFPVERVEKVNVDSIREASYKGLMLTKDENIVNVHVAVQYRVLDPENFLFKVSNPESSLRDALISAFREVVGQSNMDFILGEGRLEIASTTRDLIQQIVDGYGTGIAVTSVNLQDAQPPEQVQGAFEDAIKAREDKQRIINEAATYANSVVPTARGEAARRTQEAEAYRERIVATAKGEADRFTSVLTAYRKAPDVTRERLYIETMEDILARNPRVLVKLKEGNKMIYLPLDKILERRPGESSGTLETDSLASSPASERVPVTSTDSRSRGRR